MTGSKKLQKLFSILLLISLISLQSKGLSRVFSNTTAQKHQFFSPQCSSEQPWREILFWRGWVTCPKPHHQQAELGLESWHRGPCDLPHRGPPSIISPPSTQAPKNPENFGILQKSRQPGGDVCVYSSVFCIDVVIGGRRVFF